MHGSDFIGFSTDGIEASEEADSVIAFDLAEDGLWDAAGGMEKEKRRLPPS